jgi:hypothetical protein
MRNISTRVRVAIGAAVIAAFSVTVLTPTPAAAWWGHPGWGWHAGWHPGWHYGWRYGWRGCCWGPRFAVGIAPPVVAVAPPVVYAPPLVGPGPVWVPPQ